MRIRYNCLPCLVNQAVKVAELTDAPNRDELFRQVFAYLSEIDFTRTNPEVIGATFRMLKRHIGNDDPYRETRQRYNRLFVEHSARFENAIAAAENPFEQAIKYAILGNIIDFNPMHPIGMGEIMAYFADADRLPLTINDAPRLRSDIIAAQKLLYLGDNCGEICLDKLLIRQLRALNPNLQIHFGVRGAPVVNDSIEEDAYAVGMDECASIISNGDDSLGTVLSRVRPEFRAVYDAADVVIAKGQANYECLSEQTHKNIYFLLMTKCEVIAKDVGVPQRSLICMGGLRHD